ncbi:hypothetical protein FOA43_004212 [Brettanomyces nanus]|uniref:Cysteine dioxygenase n=1 Tax=Eeniella nana TaxID=13502 RepID=A0A875S786_EENNA|nr:uncharacterized protein FOA43_004212 [Brettanomyces nanus]QPG76818.1 hypothetical protein FOA43_004212 [Brettanomyces nanus]
MTITQEAHSSVIARTCDVNEQLSFDELVAKLGEILNVSQHLDVSNIDHVQIQALMDRYQSNEDDWSKCALRESSRGYTRNGVVNFGDNANLLILVWNPGKGSAIHDHAGAHCVMKILKGTLQEELFDNSDSESTQEPEKPKKMQCFDKHLMYVNQSRYINDHIGVHRVTNKGKEPAVSLHLYTPPYAMKYGCNIFSETAGRKSHVDMSKLYSWQGKIVNKNMYSNC